MTRAGEMAGRVRGRPWFGRLPGGIVWCLPTIYGVYVALQNLPPGNAGLLPDAQGYLQLAANFDFSIWLGNFREPVWPTLNAIPVAILGPRPTLLRLDSLLVFAALVLATQSMARDLVGRWWAIGAGVVLAASDWMIVTSLQGLREQLAALLVVLVVVATMRLRVDARRPVVLAVLVAIAAMTRWDTLILTLPVVAVALFRDRTSVKRLLPAVVAFAVIVGPFLVGNAVRFGDPLYHSNEAAVFFRNLEFQGKPGYITKAEFARNSVAGPHETWAHYLLARHSTSWLVDHTYQGTVNTGLFNWTFTVFGPLTQPPKLQLPTLSIFGAIPAFVPWLLLLATVAGAVLLLRTPGWPVGLVALVSLVWHAPIQHLMDARIAQPGVPFMVVAAAFALRRLAGRVTLRTAGAVAPTEARAERPANGLLGRPADEPEAARAGGAS
jgi:4-amino-4-deoxy-L-arabinose transferase-like glycosyltransferase